jgi:hypothetical protein
LSQSIDAHVRDARKIKPLSQSENARVGVTLAAIPQKN